jgi:hypothetical protein
VKRSRSIARAFSASRGVSFSQFFSGRPGLMYAPDDVNTLSTSRVGASFGGLSASSAVGMMLDVARGGLEGLGAELVTNGGFPSDLSGWTVTSSRAVWSAGRAHVTYTSGGASSALEQVITGLTVNRTYLLEIDFQFVAGDGRVRVFPGTDYETLSATGLYRRVFVASATSATLTFGAPSAGVKEYFVDNVSVRELPGCHQVAPSDAARPVLEAFAGTGPLAARFNGTDRSMGSLTTLDLTSTDEVTVIAAVRSLADGTDGVILEFGPNVTSTDSSFRILRRNDDKYSGASRGTTTIQAIGADIVSQPDSALLILRAKISAPLISFGRNRGAAVTNVNSQGGGTYGALTAFIGARANATVRYNGQIGRLAIIGGALTAEEELIGTGLVATPYGL